MKFVLILLVGGLFHITATADELTKPSCVQPPIPGRFASEHAVKVINKSTETYKTCMIKFADEQREVSKNTKDIAKANKAYEAAEAATKEFNVYMDRRNQRETDDN